MKEAMTVLKDGALGAVGSVGWDFLYHYVNGMLPASMQRTPGVVGMGDAIKAILTIGVAAGLEKPTKGLSGKLGVGALTVQIDGILRDMLPASVTANLAGLGYLQPNATMPGRFWFNPNSVGAHMPGSQVLGMHMQGSPALNTVAPRAAIPIPVAVTPGGAPVAVHPTATAIRPGLAGVNVLAPGGAAAVYR